MVRPIDQWLAEQNDELLNQKKTNKFFDDTIPPSGSLVRISGTFEGNPISGTFASSHHLSGASPQNVGPLAYGMLHEIVSFQDINMASHSSSNFSASRGSPLNPAYLKAKHIPISSSSEFVSVSDLSGGNVEAWIYIKERF